MTAWREIASGIEYRTLNCTADRNLHLVRLDPRKSEIAAVVKSGGTAAGVAREGGWTIAVNANFFDHQFQPLGEIISDGKELHTMQPVSWESIFFVTRDRTPRIVLPGDWPKFKRDAVVAVQAGPRIVVSGEMLRVVAGVPDWRSGVCIDEEKRVTLFVTPHESQFTAQETAAVAKQQIDCVDAMLFDGGPSAQLFAQGAANVDGDKAVPTFLVTRSAPHSQYK